MHARMTLQHCIESRCDRIMKRFMRIQSAQNCHLKKCFGDAESQDEMLNCCDLT